MGQDGLTRTLARQVDGLDGTGQNGLTGWNLQPSPFLLARAGPLGPARFATPSIAWRPWVTRQAVSGSRNPDVNEQQKTPYTYMLSIIQLCIKLCKTWFSSPNLVSLAYFGIIVSSPLITNNPPLILSLCSSFPHSILKKLLTFVLLSLYNNNKCKNLFSHLKFLL